jgi:mannose-6-phosphate isomerase-like protein (cupin superfamily)
VGRRLSVKGPRYYTYALPRPQLGSQFIDDTDTCVRPVRANPAGHQWGKGVTMSIQAGSQLPYPEFRQRYSKTQSAPVLWQWTTLAEELSVAEHTERGSLALSALDGDAESIPGVGAAFQVLKPGGRTTPHSHSWWHLYLVRSGVGRAEFDEVHGGAHLNAGDILLIPAWVQHSFENLDAEEDLVLLNLLNIPQQTVLGNLAPQTREVVDATA